MTMGKASRRPGKGLGRERIAGLLAKMERVVMAEGMRIVEGRHSESTIRELLHEDKSLPFIVGWRRLEGNLSISANSERLARFLEANGIGDGDPIFSAMWVECQTSLLLLMQTVYSEAFPERSNPNISLV
jgi:hypothetical protein